MVASRRSVRSVQSGPSAEEAAGPWGTSPASMALAISGNDSASADAGRAQQAPGHGATTELDATARRRNASNDGRASRPFATHCRCPLKCRTVHLQLAHSESNVSASSTASGAVGSAAASTSAALPGSITTSGSSPLSRRGRRGWIDGTYRSTSPCFRAREGRSRARSCRSFPWRTASLGRAALARPVRPCGGKPTAATPRLRPNPKTQA
jgi:hypothetical protein